MSDLISRAAAIDSVEIFLKQTDAPEVYPGLIPALVRVINNVPSAQQVRTQMSSADCISRQDAIDAVMDEFKRIPTSAIRAKTRIEALPSAQPERETAKFIRWMECKETVNYISYTPHCKCSKCGTEFLIETIKYCYMCGARMER